MIRTLPARRYRLMTAKPAAEKIRGPAGGRISIMSIFEMTKPIFPFHLSLISDFSASLERQLEFTRETGLDGVLEQVVELVLPAGQRASRGIKIAVTLFQVRKGSAGLLGDR